MRGVWPIRRRQPAARGLSRTARIVFITCAVIVLAAWVRLAGPGPLTGLRELAFDHFQQISPREAGDSPVRIVDIDETSLAEHGQWPWPRTKVAALVDRLHALGAAAIALDIIFAEPDRTSPARFAQSLESAATPALVEALSALPDNDAVLAAALARAPVVVGFSVSEQRNERRPPSKAGFAFAGADPKVILPPFAGSTATLDVLNEPASGLGVINISRNDVQGVVRRMPMLASDGAALYPSLAIEALRVAQGQGSILVRSTGASGEATGGAPALVDLRVGQFRVPLTADGDLWLHFARSHPELSVSARDVLDPAKAETLRERIEGQIVFVGTSAAALHDVRATPLRETVPGVTIHAQAVEQILAGAFLSRPDWAVGLEIAVAALASGVVVLLLVLLGARYAHLIGVGVSALIFVGSWLAFHRLGLLVDPTFPALTAAAAYFLVLAFLYLTSDREKRFIRGAFAQYIAPELLQRIERAPEPPKLGGEMRPMTIMFMDIRDFTPISETLTPEELVHFLNDLFSPLSEAVLQSQGTIDKYIGDSIMAFWNAPVDVPDHAAQALRATLAMRALVRRVNADDTFGFAARGRPDIQVKIGIGLNTGEACVGNMGSHRRFNYSVIGDAVNVAARIESSCKAVGSDLLVSEATVREAPGFAVLEAGFIELKGKSEPAKLFAVYGDEAVAATAEFRELAAQHAALLEALAARNVPAALAHLLECRTKAGPDFAAFYQRFERDVREIVRPTETPVAAVA